MANTRELTLPVLPLSNGVVFPHMVVTLRTETEESTTAIAAAQQSDGMLLLVSKLNGAYASVGTVAQIKDADGGNVVVEGRARARVGTLGTGEFSRPHGIAADRGGRLFVTCEPQRTLLIYRLEDESFFHVVDIGQEIPHMVAVSPDGRTAFTANVGSGTLTAVDVMMGVVLRHVEQRPSRARGLLGDDLRKDQGIHAFGRIGEQDAAGLEEFFC